MNAFINSIWNILVFVWQQITDFRVTDLLDIAITSVILFFLYRFVKQRRAGKLALGILVLFLMLLLSDALSMHVIHYLLQSLFAVGLIALIVVFQPELRSALEKMGGEPLRSLRGIGEQRDLNAMNLTIKEVTDAVCDMSDSKTGALVVFERGTKLGDIIRTGTVINADVNSFLLKNIFFNKAPMHDGAVIITNNRVYSAGCFLPLSMNDHIIKDLGTRHRAGIGMSENSDAVVVIVSEETGVISIAVEGELKRFFDHDGLRQALEGYLINETMYSRFRKKQKNKEQDPVEDKEDENE